MDARYTVHTIDLDFLGQKNGIASFLVETPDGPILVESGPHSTLPTLLKGIETLGYKKEDIQHVFLTHIHLDHAGAAWCFAEYGAQIYLHPLGYRHMNTPEKLLASAKMIYKEAMDMLWGTLQPIPAGQLTTADHGQSISIGNTIFTAWHTPGHAKHHIAWQLADNLFTGDVGGVSINHGPVIPPCPPPDINIEDWEKSIQLIEELSGINQFYLTHFGKISDTTDHLKKLRVAIRDYSQFLLPFHKKGLTVQDALPDFREFVQAYLTDHGMAPSDAMAYEAANPSDMSVTGLMRYWDKKSEMDASNNPS